MPVNFIAIEKYLLHFLTTVIALTFCCITMAQVKFSTIVNEKQPALSDYIQVEYTVENAKSVDKLDAPAFKDFRLIQGPIQTNGRSYINGVMSQYESVSFILQPLVKGRLLIPGAIAVVDGKTMRSEAVAIDVKAGASGKGNNNPGNNSLFPGLPFPEVEAQVDEEYILKPGESVSNKIKNNLLVKTDVNKTTCYEGEPIMAIFKLCSRLRSESKVLKRPSLNGFSVYDMIEPESNRPTVQNINGRPFNVHIIRQTQLIPLQAGTFTIDPVELENKVKFVKIANRERKPETRMQQLMEELMNEGMRGEVEEHSVTMASKPVTITVKPLPLANKPSSFNGAVGKFTMQAECKNKTVAAGEDISLRVLVSGAGNLTVINPPLITPPKGLEGFDPVIKEKVDKTIYPLSGSKTFDYTFVASDTGNYIIPSVIFSYFDPATNAYKTEQSDSFAIRITPAIRKKNDQRATNASGDATVKDQSIVSISLNSLFWILALLFVAALGIYKWRTGRTRKIKLPETSPPTPSPEKSIVRLASDPLEGARWHLKQGKSVEFYNEVNRSIWRLLSEKIQIPSTELNKSNIITQLQNKGADSEMVFRLQAILNECEIALYTPVHTATDMEQSLQKAEMIIKDLQTSFT